MSTTLLSLSSVPSVAGREQFVVAWVERWVQRRTGVELERDAAGNLVLHCGQPTFFITAHLDHPGFAVTGLQGRSVEVEFRGGVLPQYFPNAPLEFFDAENHTHAGTLTEYDPKTQLGVATLRRSAADLIIGRFRFRPQTIGLFGDRVQAPACDDLAGVAAALEAFDRARRHHSHVGVLLTRAEEVGFVGAIAACKAGTIPRRARVACLEASRQRREVPLGAGPVVRVGDASSVFSPEITDQAARVARGLKNLKWQRQLMAGGSCEATVFAAYGYQATCLCLPLDNYHNMGNLDAVEQGKGDARVAPEAVSLADYRGLVRLTAAMATADAEPGSLRARLEKLYVEEKRVLSDPSSLS